MSNAYLRGVLEWNYPSELTQKSRSACWQSVVEGVGTIDSLEIVRTRSRSDFCLLESHTQNVRADRADTLLRTILDNQNICEDNKVVKIPAKWRQHHLNSDLRSNEQHHQCLGLWRTLLRSAHPTHAFSCDIRSLQGYFPVIR